MSAITNRPSPASNTASSVVQIRPAHMCFEVQGMEKLAKKVNGATQYSFKVEFHPPGHPSVTEESRYTAEVPIHAPTLSEALVILQAYGQSIKNKTPQQFREMMDKLAYSAVEIDIDREKGGCEVAFTEYDKKANRFHAHSHINSKLTHQVYQELERYAEVLESDSTPLPKDSVVSPTITLSSSDNIMPHVTLTTTNTPIASPSYTTDSATTFGEPEEREKTIEFHKQAIRDALRNPSETQELDETLKAFNKLFRENFADQVKEKGFSVHTLYDTAYAHLLERYTSSEKRAILLQELAKLVEEHDEEHERLTHQFMYMVDQASEWATS